MDSQTTICNYFLHLTILGKIIFHLFLFLSKVVNTHFFKFIMTFIKLLQKPILQNYRTQFSNSILILDQTYTQLYLYILYKLSYIQSKYIKNLIFKNLSIMYINLQNITFLNFNLIVFIFLLIVVTYIIVYFIIF